MTFHPRERRALDRRAFLRRSAAFGAALAAGPSLLSACGGDDDNGSGTTPTVKRSRPDDPATLPLFDDVPPIGDGLSPESGTLKLFNYADYTATEVMRAFEKRYDVKVEMTTFTTMDEAVQKLRTGKVAFDVFFCTPDVIGKLVAGKLLQPLNRSYLDNFANVWESLQDPFYDQGARYSVAYTLYTTGVGYRRDKVEEDPYELDSGYDLIWSDRYRGKTWILDDDREALGMALLRLGYDDVNTEDPAEIEAAGRELEKLVDLANVKIGIEGYTKIPEGSAWVHQAWSGDLVNAQVNLPEGVGTDVLGYWYPPDGGGLIANDMIVIPRSADRPVLAHRFVDFLLEPDQALANFEAVGYQPPLDQIDPERLVADGLVAEHLKTAVVRPGDFERGHGLLQLTPEGEALWDDAWSKFTAGA